MNVLLGGAIGDALGVPFETKQADDPLLVDWDGKTFLGSQHHRLEPGQYSDDTQFSLAVAQSLIQNKGFDPDDLSKRYVELFTSKTIRGYGKTTLLAISNLIQGTHWSKSGVAESYGNGTAMRAAPFGVFFRNDLDALIEVIKIDSAITHASVEAETGALAIALTAAQSVNHADDFLDKVYGHLPDSKTKQNIFTAVTLSNVNLLSHKHTLKKIGTKADVRETVPAALYCFLRFNTYEKAIIAAIRAGGDTDTTAAITGALYGNKVGMTRINSQFYGVEDFSRLVVLDSQLYKRSTDFRRNDVGSQS